MAANLWTAPTQQLLAGTSVAQNTFTAAKDLPVGENTSVFPMIYGGTLNPGSRIRIEAWGVASNTATPTLILGVYYGLVAGTALAVSTAKTTTTAMTNWEWHLQWTGRVLAVGTSGSIIGSGYWKLPTSLTAWTEIRLPETAPAAVTIDTTVNKQLSIGATWSASSASNTITCHDMDVQIVG
jgi:hypothetical protein